MPDWTVVRAQTSLGGWEVRADLPSRRVTVMSHGWLGSRDTLLPHSDRRIYTLLTFSDGTVMGSWKWESGL